MERGAEVKARRLLHRAEDGRRKDRELDQREENAAWNTAGKIKKVVEERLEELLAVVRNDLAEAQARLERERRQWEATKVSGREQVMRLAETNAECWGDTIERASIDAAREIACREGP